MKHTCTVRNMNIIQYGRRAFSWKYSCRLGLNEGEYGMEGFGSPIWDLVCMYLTIA